MDRRTVFGVSQLWMGAVVVTWAVEEPGYLSLSMAVGGLCVAGIGIGILTGRVEPTIPDSELSDLERRVALTALAVGVLAFAAALVLLVF